MIVDDNVEDCLVTGNFILILLLFSSEISLVILFESFVEFSFTLDIEVIVDDNVEDCLVTGDFILILLLFSSDNSLVILFGTFGVFSLH